MKTKVGMSLLMTVLIGGSAIAQNRLETALSNIEPITPTETVETTDPVETTETSSTIVEEKPEEKIEEPVKPKRWVGKNFTAQETQVLDFFQDYGIKDRMSLAVILGNIKQESRFHSNICEGGSRVVYERCYRGGYGLIQWTTTGRYDGLGRHARNIGGNPSTLSTQLSYLVTEREWNMAKWRFVTPDKSLEFYMKGAYTWLGWGIYGNRGYYSQQYYNLLSFQ